MNYLLCTQKNPNVVLKGIKDCANKKKAYTFGYNKNTKIKHNIFQNHAKTYVVSANNY